jgi:hypothetical protein
MTTLLYKAAGEIRGDDILPLNDLRVHYPDPYERHFAKYADRRTARTLRSIRSTAPGPTWCSCHRSTPRPSSKRWRSPAGSAPAGSSTGPSTPNSSTRPPPASCSSATIPSSAHNLPKTSSRTPPGPPPRSPFRPRKPCTASATSTPRSRSTPGPTSLTSCTASRSGRRLPESGDPDTIFRSPREEYAKQLIAAIPGHTLAVA